MSPARATARQTRRAVLQGTSGLIVFGVVFGLVRGVRLDDLPFALGMLAFVVLVAGWMGLSQARTEVSAGPGWLSVRGVLRRSWVRTDELAWVKVHRCGFERVIELRDRHGRRVSVILSDLRLDPVVARQVTADVRTSVAAGAAVPPGGRVLLGVDDS
jgi:hypothetical protein